VQPIGPARLFAKAFVRWNQDVLARESPDGALPMAGLVRDKEGNLYGTTIQGGIESCVFAGRVIGCGTVFKLDASGNETVLYSFTGGTDAAGPTAALIMDKEGTSTAPLTSAALGAATSGVQAVEPYSGWTRPAMRLCCTASRAHPAMERIPTQA